MALFVLIIVGVVVGQTWFDWRKDKQNWVLPDWAKGAALGGVLAASLAAVSSFASAWMQDPAADLQGALESRVIWPEAGLVLIASMTLFLMLRKKRVPWLLLITGMIVAAAWLGISLAS